MNFYNSPYILEKEAKLIANNRLTRATEETMVIQATSQLAAVEIPKKKPNP